MTELTAQLALELGGWDPRYATVLVIATDGVVGVSLIDPNSDGNMTEVEHLYRDDSGQWHAGSSSGGGTPEVFGVHGWGTHGGTHRAHYVYGCAEQRGQQTVTHQGRQLVVTPEPTGWWAIVEGATPEGCADIQGSPHTSNDDPASRWDAR